MFVYEAAKAKNPISIVESHGVYSILETRYEKCRFLYLVGQLQAGGLERQLYYLLQGMDRKCYQPAVVVWNFGSKDFYVDEIRNLGVPIFSFSSGASRREKLNALRVLVRRLNPEVVHSYSFFTNFAVQWASWNTRTVSIGSVRSDFSWAKKQCGPILGCLCARWPCAQIYNSQSAANQAHESKSFCIPKKIFMVRNGLDLKRFDNLYKSIPGQGIILGIGSLYHVKRWERLLVAAAEIMAKGEEFRIQIVGDGPLRFELQQKTIELGITSYVEFLGHRPDIPTLLSHAKFLVHTSDSEGCPNVIMEAMACGRPVVAMDAGDIPFLVDDEKTGFVVPQGDHVNLVERILELLQNHSTCLRMGTAAREKAEREFGVERLVKETMEVYQAAGWKS